LWQYYRFENYETYFYEGGKNIAIFTAKFAKEEIERQQKLLDFYLKDKIQFVIYNKQSHYKQSNVGLTLGEQYNIGGVTKIIGSKVFLYFEGDYTKLKRQIKAGIAEVLINQLLYGGSWRDAVKSSTLLHLPDWYLRGLIEYIADDGLPIEKQDRIKDGVFTGKYKKFNRLTGQEAILAGQSLWNYIAETYGKKVIPNILFMNKVSQSLERGFLFVLGLSTKNIVNEWLVYYQKQFELNEQTLPMPTAYKTIPKKIKKNRVYQHFVLSPDGVNAAYVTNQMGQYKVYITDLTTGKNKRIFKKEQKADRINDYSYPVLAWHPTGEILAFITEEKGLLKLNFYNVDTKELYWKTVFNLEKILWIDYAPKGTEMVFSAYYKGQTDIYLYNIGANTHKKLTDDYFSDLHPQFSPDGNQITFISDRTNDTLTKADNHSEPELYNAEKDVFVLDLKNPKVLKRVTNTPNISESQPYFTDTSVIYLASYQNQVARFSASYDSAVTFVDTMVHYRYFYKPHLLTLYKRNIVEQSIENTTKQYSEILYHNQKYILAYNNLSEISGASTVNTIKENINNKESVSDKTAKGQYKNQMVFESRPLKKEEKNPQKIDYKNYKFQDEVSDNNTSRVIVIKPKPQEQQTPFTLPNQRNYNLSFFSDNSTTQLNNSFINQQYQLFNGGPYISPGIGGNFQVGASDLFEDYRIRGSVRLGAANEYSVTFQNLVKRLDKEYTFTRTEYRNKETTFLLNNVFLINGLMDTKTNQLHYSLRYPFNEFLSLRTTFTARHDKYIAKATDVNLLAAENKNQVWGIGKIALVFDNTREKMLNIMYGTRFRIFAEHYQPVYDKEKENGQINVVGFDFRHYQKIHRELIYVFRAAASSSFGSQKIIYYLGSVDDWMVLGKQPMFMSSTNIDYSQNYKFQALAANLRGFPQNIRNGNNFAVLNNEIRWPVFKYFIRKPIQSDFIRNFQLIAFGDIGTAWTGWDPYSKDNSLNKQTIVSGPLTVVVNTNREPIVGGYGWGMRFKFMGYFIRTDWAWGIADGTRTEKPIFYLSLSKDI
jgi:Tol biopolymer transport system component